MSRNLAKNLLANSPELRLKPSRYVMPIFKKRAAPDQQFAFGDDFILNGQLSDDFGDNFEIKRSEGLQSQINYETPNEYNYEGIWKRNQGGKNPEIQIRSESNSFPGVTYQVPSWLKTKYPDAKLWNNDIVTLNKRFFEEYGTPAAEIDIADVPEFQSLANLPNKRSKSKRNPYIPFSSSVGSLLEKRRKRGANRFNLSLPDEFIENIPDHELWTWNNKNKAKILDKLSDTTRENFLNDVANLDLSQLGPSELIVVNNLLEKVKNSGRDRANLEMEKRTLDELRDDFEEIRDDRNLNDSSELDRSLSAIDQ